MDVLCHIFCLSSEDVPFSPPVSLPKGFLDGVGAELQASETHELEEAEMKDRVHAALTRK